MHIPLISTVVGEEVVDHPVKARPVCAIVSIGRLRAGNGDMRIPVTLDDCVTHGLIRARERDLHESAVVGPGCKVAALARFFSGRWNYLSPVFETGAPLFVERGKRVVLLL